MKALNFLVFVLISFALVNLGIAKQEKPNILYITFDDMNDWVGCLGGHPQIRTPNIDRLA